MKLETLTETRKLQTRINLAIKDVRKGWRASTRTVKTLKNRINELELGAFDKGRIRGAYAEELNSAIEELDKFTDSVISDSAKAWEKYRGIRQECEILGFEPTGTERLRTLCAEYEQLAKDLLCYSLGHLRQASHI